MAETLGEYQKGDSVHLGASFSTRNVSSLLQVTSLVSWKASIGEQMNEVLK